MSGQKLCQILAPALLAEQRLLSFQNEKFVHLAALLTTVLINRHIFSFPFAGQHSACLCSNLFVPFQARFNVRMSPDERDMHSVQKALEVCSQSIIQDSP